MSEKSSSSVIKKICALLRNDDPELQQASAIVLGELRSKDKSVVKALGEVLTISGSNGLKNHVLDSFGKIRSKDSLQYLLSFLLDQNNEDKDLHEKASLITSHLGQESLREIKSLIKNASLEEKIVINSIFIKMKTVEGLKAVLNSLYEENEVLISEICRQMELEMRMLDPEERKVFSHHVEKYLGSQRTRKNMAATGAAIQILGHIGEAGTLEGLLKYSTLQNPSKIRKDALNSLRLIPLTGKVKNEVIRKLVSYLEENDFDNVVSPTLDILSRAPIHSSLNSLIIKLLESKQEAVRSFALRKLREFNTLKVVKVLIAKLEDAEPRTRDLAAESLCWLDASRNILLEMLLKEESLERAGLLSWILRPHATKLRKDQVRQIGQALKKSLDSKSPLQQPLIILLKRRDPDYLHDMLLKRASDFRKSDDNESAVETLKILQKNKSLGVEAQYLLATCLLKIHRHRRGKDRQSADPSLEIFQKLLQNDTFPLAQKLKNDASIDSAELHYLADYFSQRTRMERLFARNLQRTLTKKSSKSQTGNATKAKMRAEG